MTETALYLHLRDQSVFHKLHEVQRFFISYFKYLKDFLCRFYVTRKDTLAVCMTQKHQLKTFPCIIYLLGWDLSQCMPKILILTKTWRVSEWLHIFVGEFNVVVFYLFKFYFNGFVIVTSVTHVRSEDILTRSYLKVENGKELRTNILVQEISD